MSFDRMVALGSSFAAGPGIEPVADRAAMRSQRNYPQLVATALGASLVDATVSGATTDTILRRPQRRGRRRYPAQIESVDPRLDVDLITVTVGGNDLGYLGSVLRAAVGNSLARRSLTAPLGWLLRGKPAPIRADQVEEATAGLTAIVEAAAERAPHARILLVDYLTIIGPTTRPGETVPFTEPELVRFRDTADQLAAVFRLAEQRSVAELIPMSALSASHAVDAPEPWVSGLQGRPLTRLGSSFHPNAAGMQAVAGAVLRHLGVS